MCLQRLIINNPSSPHPIKYGTASRVKMALIAEVGSQRGIFTAGILDAWLEHNVAPFDLFIGISAGPQNLTSFLSHKKDYAKQLIDGLSRRKRFYQAEHC